MKKIITTALLTTVATASFAQGAPLWLADGWNVFVRNDFKGMNSDVEGRVAVGGNLTVENYSVGEKLNGFRGDSLYVMGEFNYKNGQVFNGNVRTGDTTPTRQGFNILNGTLTTGSTPLWVPTVFTELVARAGFLATQSATGTTTFQNGGLTLSGGSGDTLIYNVNGNDLKNANNFTINAPAGKTVLVNITGTDTSFKNAGFNLQGGVTSDKVLLNFAAARNLEFSGIGVNANILAPQADLIFNNGLITGQVISRSFTGGGQVNIGNFNGTVPVPEPASMAALAIGVIGFARKRRK